MACSSRIPYALRDRALRTNNEASTPYCLEFIKRKDTIHAMHNAPARAGETLLQNLCTATSTGRSPPFREVPIAVGDDQRGRYNRLFFSEKTATLGLDRSTRLSPYNASDVIRFARRPLRRSYELLTRTLAHSTIDPALNRHSSIVRTIS